MLSDSILRGGRQKTEWVGSSTLQFRLGVSRQTLYDLRQRGVLQAGAHFVQCRPGVAGSKILWDLQATEEALRMRSEWAAEPPKNWDEPGQTEQNLSGAAWSC